MGKHSFASKNALAFIIRLSAEKKKLALENFDDFEQKENATSNSPLFYCMYGHQHMK